MDINTIQRIVKYRAIKYVNERKGWTTNRRIIIIESDDWGSIRMPSIEVYKKLLDRGIRVDRSVINKFDTLASKDDFEHLFSILYKYKDKNGNHPIITLNTIVANPDFDKIKESNFEEYFYEPFIYTLEKYDNTSFRPWVEGINNKMIYPQLHGREHLNVERWMRFLKSGSKEVHFAFDNGLYGIGSDISLEGNPSFVPAFSSGQYLDGHLPENIIGEASKLFSDIFGFDSKSFIAPNYIWNDNIEKVLSENKVEYLQGSFINKDNNSKNRYSYIGKINSLNQIYTARNVHFEPSSANKSKIIPKVLKQIENAFNLKKPAIISSHRYNFVGSIFEANRIENLNLLDKLLEEILSRWPNVEFMHSENIGSLIRSDIRK